MTDEPPFYEALGFDQRLGDWVDSQNPPPDVTAAVIVWIRSQVVRPYGSGARRLPDVAPNYWWVRIPGTYLADDHTDVMCGYYIDEEMRQIRCDTIGTLPRPNLS